MNPDYTDPKTGLTQAEAERRAAAGMANTAPKPLTKTAAQIVRTLKESGRTVFLDVDLVEGLSAREAAVDFVAQEVRPDGVISTKAALVRRAKAKGLLTVYRTFMIDSMALSALLRADALASADFV